MTKKYLLDTSVLMNDPDALFEFEEHQVVLHYEVLKELESKKTGNDDVHFHARKAMRSIDQLLDGYHGEPIKINDQGGTLVLAKDTKQDWSHADPALLAYLEKRKEENQEVILISEDIALRAKAKWEGFRTEVHKHERGALTIKDILEMQEEIDLPPQHTQELRSRGFTNITLDTLTTKTTLYRNQYLHVKGQGDLLLRYNYDGTHHKFERLPNIPSVYGIVPKNKEQRYLADLCLNKEIQIGTALGKAGTGKTLISLAAGLQLFKQGRYKRIMIIRPVSRIGEDVGFLPGHLEDKLDPFMRAIYDAAEVIFSQPMRRKLRRHEDIGETPNDEQIDSGDFDWLLKEGKIQLQTPTYIQGRSISHTYIIVDEAQNYNRATTKMIATRIGPGSKMIFSGDPYQVVTPYLDENNNGLTIATKRFLNEPNFSSTILNKGERSKAAEMAARLL